MRIRRTRYVMLSVMHRQWFKPDPLVDRPVPHHARDGLLVLVDWEGSRVVWALPWDSPAGLIWCGDSMWLASMQGHRITILDATLSPSTDILHPLFNDLHTLCRTPRGVLVAASGIDAILEVTEAGHLTWAWLATEHGFHRLRDGRHRTVDQRFDYSSQPPGTTSQTTHLNSARMLTSGQVVATLFMQGMVVSINPRTGAWTPIVTGMDRPHAFRPGWGEGWTVCDTGGNAVVLLDKEFGIVRLVEMGFDWVQDAIMWDQHSMLVLDANNMRLVEVDIPSRAVIGELRYPAEWKAFGIEPVPQGWNSVGEGSPKGALVYDG